MKKRCRKHNDDEISFLEDEHVRLRQALPPDEQGSCMMTLALGKGFGMKLSPDGTRQLKIARRLFEVESDLCTKQKEYNEHLKLIELEVLCKKKFDDRNSVLQNVAKELVTELMYMHWLRNKREVIEPELRDYEKLLMRT